MKDMVGTDRRQSLVRRVQARVRKLTLDKQVSVEDFLAWKREQAELEALPAFPRDHPNGGPDSRSVTD